jgi:hypothetical protein
MLIGYNSVNIYSVGETALLMALPDRKEYLYFCLSFYEVYVPSSTYIGIIFK